MLLLPDCPRAAFFRLAIEKTCAAKSFEDITFGIVSWLHQSVVKFGSSFFPSRFKAAGPISNLVSSDGIKDLLVEVHTESSVTFTLECNQRLEGIQCLNDSFEADRSRFHIVFAGGLGDDRADQIVREDRHQLLQNMESVRTKYDAQSGVRPQRGKTGLHSIPAPEKPTA